MNRSYTDRIEFNHNIDLIGSGALFPIELTKNDQGETGWYAVEGDSSLIENNLHSLVEYIVGQRFRQEGFGTRLWECIEESNTQALNFLIREFLTQSISEYEPRIIIKNIVTARESNKLNITMEYSIVDLGKQSYMTLTYEYN